LISFEDMPAKLVTFDETEIYSIFIVKGTPGSKIYFFPRALNLSEIFTEYVPGTLSFRPTYTSSHSFRPLALRLTLTYLHRTKCKGTNRMGQNGWDEM
jgi:hypothetical protein